jgi:shikimate kinase
MTGKSLVYIIGFMGSGKSTAGRKLAVSLGWTFVDLDRKIEEMAGKTIPQIFSDDGEEKFRELETRVLQGLKSEARTIISTGGGTPCHGDNMDIMLTSGLTIYLKMTPEQLTSRLLESTGQRPLLKNIPDNKLNEFISKKLASREKWYNKANITLEGKNLDINLLTSLIKNSQPT